MKENQFAVKKITYEALTRANKASSCNSHLNKISAKWKRKYKCIYNGKRGSRLKKDMGERSLCFVRFPTYRKCLESCLVIQSMLVLLFDWQTDWMTDCLTHWLDEWLSAWIRRYLMHDWLSDSPSSSACTSMKNRQTKCLVYFFGHWAVGRMGATWVKVAGVDYVIVAQRYYQQCVEHNNEQHSQTGDWTRNVWLVSKFLSFSSSSSRSRFTPVSICIQCSCFQLKRFIPGSFRAN